MLGRIFRNRFSIYWKITLLLIWFIIIYHIIQRHYCHKHSNMTEYIRVEDYWPFRIDYFPKEILKIREKETNITAAEKDQSLQKLKNSLQGHNSSKEVDFEDDFLNSYLSHCNHNETAAFTMLQNYLNFRQKYLFLYQKIKFDLGSCPSCKFATFLPRRLSDGSVMVLLEPANWDPEELPFETAKQIFYMIFQQELRNPVTQASGFHIIADFANVRYGHYKYCTPENGVLLKHGAFDVIPGNYIGVHFINSNFIVSSLLTISKPFIPEFFRKKIHVHSSPEKLLDHFPRLVLPEKYGGTLENYDCDMPDFLRRASEQHEKFPVGGQKNIF